MNNLAPRGLTALLVASALMAGCVSDGGSSKPTHGNRVFIDSGVLEGTWNGYVTVVPRGTTELAVELFNLSQDADLFVESPGGFEACESFASGKTPELCVFPNPVPGEWYIEVEGWGRGETFYTLSANLRPSFQRASLFAVDQGLLSATMATPLSTLASHDGVVAQTSGAEQHLQVLAAAWDVAAGLALGESATEVRFQVLSGDTVLGEAILIPGETDGRRSVHIKAMLRDPVSGERYSVQTRDQHPLIAAASGGAPEQGIVQVRIGDVTSSVRLGMDSGTGADVQIMTEPGPVVVERTWESLGDGRVRLEPKQP